MKAHLLQLQGTEALKDSLMKIWSELNEKQKKELNDILQKG